MLEHVDARVLERGVVERGDVPEPHHRDVEHDGEHRMRQRPGGLLERAQAPRRRPQQDLRQAEHRQIGTRSSSSTCCVMCIASACSASASIGETSATSSSSEPGQEAQQPPDRRGRGCRPRRARAPSAARRARRARAPAGSARGERPGGVDGCAELESGVHECVAITRGDRRRPVGAGVERASRGRGSRDAAARLVDAPRPGLVLGLRAAPAPRRRARSARRASGALPVGRRRAGAAPARRAPQRRRWRSTGPRARSCMR